MPPDCLPVALLYCVPPAYETVWTVVARRGEPDEAHIPLAELLP